MHRDFREMTENSINILTFLLAGTAFLHSFFRGFVTEKQMKSELNSQSATLTANFTKSLSEQRSKIENEFVKIEDIRDIKKGIQRLEEKIEKK